MGTRNITAVILNKKIVVSQYGQWDGHFESAGMGVIQFIKEYLLEDSPNKCYGNSFVENLKVCKDIKSDKQYTDELQGIIDKYCSDRTSNWHIPYKVMFPQLTRDTGYKILELIARNINAYEFSKKQYFPILVNTDCNFIEFVNVLDMDKRKLYMLSDWSCTKAVQKKVPKLIENTYPLYCYAIFDIDNLPSDEDLQEFGKRLFYPENEE